MFLKKEGLLGAVSIVLTAALVLGILYGVAGKGYYEPVNPITPRTDNLVAETFTGSGNLQNIINNAQNNNENAQGDVAPSEPQPTPQVTPPSETTPPQEPEQTPQPEQTQASSDDSQSKDENGDPQENQGQNQGGTETGDQSDDGYENDKDGEGTAGGDGTGDGIGDGGTGDGEDSGPKIATDLRTKVVTKAEIADDIFKFYAYPVGESEGELSVKVVLKNSETSQNGKTITSQDGINYQVKLVLNEENEITLYLKEDGNNISYARYIISYEAVKADETTPTVGEFPPTIVTNLDGYTELMEQQDFLLWVSARTNPSGEAITSDRIEVWLNGKLVQKQTGDATPEYQLHFEPPNVGDYATYTVKIRAWDGKGNSTFKTYTLNYHTVSEGDYLGEV
ncbi:MAG: hypothetical protein IJW74_05020, partial [Oscillospiraceae bacterium]|nr:hypothetical protein [Oscillospiraceae bacterium]